MVNPLISLIIPTYNVEDYISNAIHSVKKQTLTPSNFEVVIIDDGSKDKTPFVIKKEIKDMVNVLYYGREKNKGTAFTRNEAIYLSSGSWIAYLDGDDFLFPNALESTLGFHKKHPQIQYSYSQHARVSSDGKTTIQIRPPHIFNKNDLYHFNFISAIVCFSKELHKEIGGYDIKSEVEDWDHAIKSSEVLEESQIACNPEVLYYYRIHNQMKSVKDVDKVRTTAINTLTKALKRKGIEAKVWFSHKTLVGNSYYDWRQNESFSYP